MRGATGALLSLMVLLLLLQEVVLVVVLMRGVPIATAPVGEIVQPLSEQVKLVGKTTAQMMLATGTCLTAARICGGTSQHQHIRADD